LINLIRLKYKAPRPVPSNRDGAGLLFTKKITIIRVISSLLGIFLSIFLFFRHFEFILSLVGDKMDEKSLKGEREANIVTKTYKGFLIPKRRDSK